MSVAANTLVGLQRMTVEELRREYAKVFGEPTTGRNKPWLIKRISWRLQALAEGDLSERARRRALELANDADLRMTPPREPTATEVGTDAADRTTTRAFRAAGDPRLPPPGAMLTRNYRGRELAVQVLADGFEFEGQRYKSLSAIAQAVTGAHWNGYHFFGLERRGATQ